MNNFTNSNSSLTYHPELGGLVSGLVLDGQEILYCDEASLTSNSIRGGIPTMLPNPGIGDGILPRHGIARTSSFAAQEAGNSITLTLGRNQHNIENERYSLFPHDFVYELVYELIDHGCIITQQVTNPVSPLSGRTSVLEGVEGSGVRMGFGLHPYFPTPNSITQVQHGVQSDLIIDHYNDDTAVLLNPGQIVLSYPTYRLTISYSDIYRRIWVWTPPGHDTICIEPVTHDVGAYFADPLILQSGQKIHGIMKFEIETLG